MLEEVITKISGAFKDTLPEYDVGCTITHNPHKITGKDVDQYVLEDDETLWASPQEMGAAISNNELWCLTWYPKSRYGQCRIYASTLPSVMIAMYHSELERAQKEIEAEKAKFAIPTKVQVTTPSGYTMASSDFTKPQTAQETASQLMAELGIQLQKKSGLILP
jgi:hypothetical protein